MNKDVLDYIQTLSLRDKKNLAEKALKVSEESGELSKAVLPYVSAYATNHRFVDKYKILEEVADTILASISIAYDLGFTHEDIESVIDQKSRYWQSLQDREDAAQFPLPYEIHITVETGCQGTVSIFSLKTLYPCNNSSFFIRSISVYTDVLSP
jgi:NTP pyrophosphatase (non-canonical NTP hydrolase)